MGMRAADEPRVIHLAGRRAGVSALNDSSSASGGRRRLTLLRQQDRAGLAIASHHAAAEAPAADPEPPDVVGGVRGTVLERHGYTVGRSIGSGSYATVKIAHSDRHDREVAIKIVSKFRAPKDYLRKFLPREIEVVKGLRHKNLIRFYQAIETTHRVYIVMEYAPNGSLLEVIRRESYIKEPRARVWFRQLVDAVEYCHNQGVVHRDIKCENLLLDEEMNVRLSDFGFARGRMKARDRQPPPMSETFCGSYAYAAPEILRGTPYRPQLSDIWSMGVVLYAMIFGRLPFDDSNYTQLLKQVQSKVMFPRQPRASAAVRSLITRILSPARTRLRIPDIRTDVWMAPGTDDAAAQQGLMSLSDQSAKLLIDLEKTSYTAEWCKVSEIAGKQVHT
ncbi:testis-specific serine/threonine-protein kinase 4-like [Schistocerca nitens]|uniref:testis-specific serine/threonine-protein kinase 4-like n=1 Tax=Schistocerca nitens TaxID=7011 RepID=UPI002118A78B|nr:testis-specific serine/threonine-protein kinase 4-like [Schistocerca nitens]